MFEMLIFSLSRKVEFAEFRSKFTIFETKVLESSFGDFEGIQDFRIFEPIILRNKRQKLEF